jgi:transposase
MERYTEKINKHIFIIKQKDRNNQLIVSVFYDYIPVARFNHDKSDERKLAAVELVERQISNITTAAKICGFHRNTISQFLVTKQTLGIKVLLEDNRGLKKPLKYKDDVRETIERLLCQHPDWSDQKIATQASELLDMDVHRNGVARIRVANLSPNDDEVFCSKDRLIELSKIAETIDQQKNDDRQLELNFEADEQFKQKKQQLEQLEPLQSTHKSEQNLIERLQQGQRSPFAGSFMHHLFLNEITYEKLFNCLPFIKGNTYQHRDILTMLYFTIANGLKSIESIKLVNAKDFGCVLGMDRSPDKDIIRKKLHNLSALNYSEPLIDGFARILLENNRIDDEVFFIDGHFLPYYGLCVIAKGYYTVRRLAMKGNELYVISDLNGRPLFFITESNDVDFRPIILRAADKLIELGIKRPILTFDRGGYGVRFFNELDDKADFVTWAKYLSDKQLDRISDECFKHGLPFNDNKYLVAEQIRDVSESIQTARKEGRDRPITIPLRLVVMENIDTGQRMGIYTNNKDKCASDVAYYMLNRWGDSENLYKELMSKFNLNYHPGYDIDELDNQPFVDNPDMALIKEAIHILQQEIDQLLTNQQDVQIRLSQQGDKRLTKKLSTIVKELEQNKHEQRHF